MFNLFKKILNTRSNEMSDGENQKNDNQIVTSYFKNGKLVKVTPKNAHPYDSTIIMDDGIKFNMINENEVSRIPIPRFNHKEMPNVTHNEDYIFRMIAGKIRKTNKPLSIVILKKATELMLESNIGWLHTDFLRLVRWLYEDGLIKEAEDAEAYFNNKVSLGNINNTNEKEYMFNIVKQNCISLNTDIVISSTIFSCSEEDALIRNRLFSISGNHPSLSKAPNLASNSLITFHPFFLGMSSMENLNGNKVRDPIKYSNRPLVDDRTKEEKKNYLEKVDKRNNDFINWIIYKQFYYLKYNFPDKCPKTKNALKSMYGKNKEEYIKLISTLPKSYQINNM